MHWSSTQLLQPRGEKIHAEDKWSNLRKVYFSWEGLNKFNEARLQEGAGAKFSNVLFVQVQAAGYTCRGSSGLLRRTRAVPCELQYLTGGDGEVLQSFPSKPLHIRHNQRPIDTVTTSLLQYPYAAEPEEDFLYSRELPFLNRWQ